MPRAGSSAATASSCGWSAMPTASAPCRSPAETAVFTFIVPVHNESAALPGTMQRLDEARARYPIDAIVAVENGSRDDTWAVLQQLAGRYPALRIFAEPAAGIGHAYHRGIA